MKIIIDIHKFSKIIVRSLIKNHHPTKRVEGKECTSQNKFVLTIVRDLILAYKKSTEWPNNIYRKINKQELCNYLKGAFLLDL